MGYETVENGLVLVDGLGRFFCPHFAGPWSGGPRESHPPGSHRTERDSSLPSLRSCHSDHQKHGVHAQWAKSLGCRLVIRRQHRWAALNDRNRLYFLRIQRIR